MLQGIRPYAQAVARFLEPSSSSERERRGAHAVALLLVALVATVKAVSGLTPGSVPFTLYLFAVCGAGARGGFAPAVVAMLASLLVADFSAAKPTPTDARVLFVIEAVAVAAIVSAVRALRRRTEEQLAAVEASNDELRRRDRHGRIVLAALRHLEQVADDSAVVVLNDNGMITDWPGSAARMYGYGPDRAKGADAGALLFEHLSRTEFAELLGEARDGGIARRSDIHRDANGTRIHVEMEVRPFRDLDAHGFTVAVRDTARLRDWAAYRDAATRAQAALQQSADEAQQRLASLESLVDPSLTPMANPDVAAELLERLRSLLGADGAALVPTGAVGGRLVAVGGIQPATGPRSVRSDRQRLAAPGRVTLIHNDPARVDQASALRWPESVTSLMVVPVGNDSDVWSTIEVVSERPRRASDWDAALMRVAADRLAAIAPHDTGFTAKVS